MDTAKLPFDEISHMLGHEETHLQGNERTHIKAAMTVGSRLKQARERAGMSQAELATKVGVDQGTISNIERNVTANPRHLVRLAAACGVDPLWLSSGKGDMEGIATSTSAAGTAEPPAVPYQPPSADEVAILQYDTGGRGGPGLVLRDQPGVIQRWSVSTDWLRANVPHYTSPQNLHIVTGFGDSMPDTYNPGDPVLVDVGVTVCDHDGVYFFRVEEEGFIKRLQRIPGQGIRVLSQNKEYEPWTITPDMDFQVFGKVLKAWKGKTY